MSFNLFEMTNRNEYGLGVGISIFYKFSKHTQEGVGDPKDYPIFHLIFYIVPYMNIYDLRVGISTVINFSNRRGWGEPVTYHIFHLICFIVQYMNIYG